MKTDTTTSCSLIEKIKSFKDPEIVTKFLLGTYDIDIKQSLFIQRHSRSPINYNELQLDEFVIIEFTKLKSEIRKKIEAELNSC